MVASPAASELVEPDATKPPREFGFPYRPYEIQSQFMQHLYETLEGAADDRATVAVMESPTGTGKSLSIICGALTWLRDAKARRDQPAGGGAGGEALPDWVQNFDPKQKKRQMRKRKEQLHRNKWGGQAAERLAAAEQGEEDFCLKDEDDALLLKRRLADSSSSDSDSDSDSKAEDEPLQLLFCSRTHSQLAQFVREINKTQHRRQLKVVTLGSRKTLCINEAVNKLLPVALMNERCLDLRQKRVQKPRSASAVSAAEPARKLPGCSFLDRRAMHMFQQAAVEQVQDIEQHAALGKQLHGCAFYGAQRVAEGADVVCMPYNLLFRAEAREALHIQLQGRVVVVDEAHNLHD
jgi:chromosome transmission fidelity protein 1